MIYRQTSSKRYITNPFFAVRKRLKQTPPAETQPYRILDLFSGIGGFSLGFERAGMQTAAFCEIDPFCRQLLAHHWPAAKIYDDIKQLTARSLKYDNVNHIDLICGGYPCQPFSVAGRQRGENDPRHLWPEMHRLIRELRPRWVVCENVDGHVELGLDTVLTDLENAGYTNWPFVIPACAVGLSHRRDRVWISAHAGRFGLVAPATIRIAKGLPDIAVRGDFPSSFTCGIDDGIPSLLDRLRVLGNAVVPQIPEIIGRAILAFDADASKHRLDGQYS